jgi:hypothetical protein
MKRRRLILITIAVASLTLAAGTAAFTATSADRGVDVRVADDGNAYITVEKFPNFDTSDHLTLSTNETTKWITVMRFENNIPSDSVSQFDAELRSGGGHPAMILPSGGAGEYDIDTTWDGSGTLDARMNCGKQGSGTLTFDIEIVTDGGVSVDLTRSVTVKCENPGRNATNGNATNGNATNGNATNGNGN